MSMLPADTHRILNAPALRKGNPKFEQRVRSVWPDEADAILAIIRGPMSYVDDLPVVQTSFAGNYNAPSPTERRMCALNEAIRGYGVEAIFSEAEKWPDMEYVNMGDSYIDTIIYDYTAARWRVNCVGDWIEHAQPQGYTYD